MGMSDGSSWSVEVSVRGEIPNRGNRRDRPDMVVVPEPGGQLVRLTVEASDAGEAIGRALSLLGAGDRALRVEAMSVEQRERELEQPRLPDLLGIVDIQELAGLNSKQRALQVTALPSFPGPALETRAGRLWTRAAVERFLRYWPRRPGRQTKVPPARD